MPSSLERLRTHALLSQAMGSLFVDLGLSASLLDGDDWHPLYIPIVFQHSEIVADVVIFERVHGVAARRAAYNARAVRRMRGEGGSLLATHAGFYDLFVPVGDRFGTLGMVVTGPFARTRPTSADLRARWRWLTGRTARASDPEFTRYLATVLATATFEGDRLDVFRRWVETFARVLAGQGPIDALAAQAHTLAGMLEDVRYVERMWTAARNLTDEGVWRSWRERKSELIRMGLARLPESVVVGLLLGRDPESDAVEDLLRRDALQRACVGLVRGRGGALCGPIGDHGIVFLLDEPGSGPRAHAKLLEIGRRAAALASDFGLSMHLGVSTAERPLSLPARFQNALSAAELALSTGAPVASADALLARAAARPLDDLRRELVRTTAENPLLLAPRFERYLESVRAHCGYRVDATRAHLEVGLHQVLRALHEAGALDERSVAELSSSIERSSQESSTVGDLCVAYRKVIADVELALDRPRDAHKDRSLRRAIAFIREHASEPLGLAKVSRVAGFAPGYFSKLFRRTEGITFREYTQKLRIRQAGQMLLSTTLSAEKVGHLCGFRTRQCFHAIFRRHTGMTPFAYRRRAPPEALTGDNQPRRGR
jgi:AraC-like DNA-binding protein